MNFFFKQEPSCESAENNILPPIPVEAIERCSPKVFPELNGDAISRHLNQQENLSLDYTAKSVEPCVVPSNPLSSRQQHYIPSRKLEVLKDCVAYIFDNQISEARKVNLLYFVLLLLAVCISWILYISHRC